VDKLLPTIANQLLQAIGYALWLGFFDVKGQASSTGVSTTATDLEAAGGGDADLKREVLNTAVRRIHVF
jgi:hypothetical protein